MKLISYILYLVHVTGVYNTHGMISHLPPQQQNNVQRPGSAQNSVAYGYEPTPSPIG